MTPMRPAAPRLATRTAAILVVGALTAAACGGGDSALDAGLDDEPEPETAEPADGDDEADPPELPPAETDPDQDSQVDSDDGEAGDDAGASDGDADGAADDDPDADSDPDASNPALAGLPDCPVDEFEVADVEGPIEITMWFGLADQLAGVLQELTDEFNASQGDVVVSIENQTDYETTIDNYLNLGESNRPEVLLVPEFIVQTFVESDSFVPIEACFDAAGTDTSMFLERGLTTYSYDGVQWGVPFNMSSPILYYLKPRFEAAGLDPDSPPTSFEEMRAASEALVASGASAYGEVVDVARDATGARIEQWFGQLEEPFVDGGNGREARATEALFGTETGLDLLRYLRDMRADDLSFNVGTNAGGLDAFLKLIDPAEPGAMTVATSAGIVQVLDALGGGIAPDLTIDDVGVGYLPGPDGSIAAQVGGASLWIPAGRGDLETAAAWRYIEFLTSAQSQSTWAAGTGYVPMRSDSVELDPVATLFAEDPRFRVSYDQLAAPTGSINAARPALGPQREVRQVLADLIATIYQDPSIDDATLQTLLDEAVAEANSLISTYNRLN